MNITGRKITKDERRYAKQYLHQWLNKLLDNPDTTDISIEINHGIKTSYIKTEKEVCVQPVEEYNGTHTLLIEINGGATNTTGQ